MATTNAGGGYPPGPITCCLKGISKEIRVRDDNTWTVSLVISWITSVIAMLLYIVAFGTMGWAKVVTKSQDPETERVTREIGLWQECHSETGCSYYDGKSNGPGFKAAQAIAVLSLVAVIIETFLIIAYTFYPDSPTNYKVGKAALWSKLTAVILLLVLMPVFAVTWYKPKYQGVQFETSKSFSFTLTVVAFVLEAIGVFFMYCEMVVIPANQPKKLVEDRTVNYHDGVLNPGFNDGSMSSIHPGNAIILPNQQRSVDHLPSLVTGHLNAKAAFQNFTLDNPETQNQYPSGSLRASRDSLFNSSDGIAKRFVGITKAEPEYMSNFGSQSTLATITDSEYAFPAPSEPTIPEEMQQPIAKDMSNSRQQLFQPSADNTPVIPRRDVSVPKENFAMKNSASMQNIYNDNHELRRDESGQFITSVSMYNLADQPAVLQLPPGQDRDLISLSSGHPGQRASSGVIADIGNTRQGAHKQYHRPDLPRSQDRQQEPTGSTHQNISSPGHQQNRVIV